MWLQKSRERECSAIFWRTDCTYSLLFQFDVAPNRFFIVSIPIDHSKHYPTWIHITKHPVYIAHEENRSNVSMSRKREPLSGSVIIRNVRALARPTLDVHTMHFSRRLPAALLPWDVSQANQCDAYPEFTGETGWELSGEGEGGVERSEVWIRSVAGALLR